MTGRGGRLTDRPAAAMIAHPLHPRPCTEEIAMKLTDAKLFRQQCYIDGAWVDAYGRGTIPVENPANGERLGTVPKMGDAETSRAIEAADRAMPAWQAKTAKERAAILRK